MILSNYAEDNNGLLYLSGAGWDAITARAPLEGGPQGAFAVIQGTLVIRLLFDITETGRDHTFAVAVIDEDGREIGKVEGSVRVDRVPGLPTGWDQNVNIVIPLSGFPVPKPGLFAIKLQVDGQHLGDRPFRVIKGY